MSQRKQERREAARRKRLEEQRRRERLRRRKMLIRWVAIALVVAAVVGFGGVQLYRSRVQLGRDTRAAGCTDVKDFPIQTAAPHLQPSDPPPNYNSNPPTSGQHLGSTAPWGVVDETIEDRLLVHNLEHGGVIIHYKDLPSDQVDELEEFVDAFPPDNGGVIAQPNEEITSRVAFAAWGKLQTCREFRISVARNFIRQHCNKGPERTGLACTGP